MGTKSFCFFPMLRGIVAAIVTIVMLLLSGVPAPVAAGAAGTAGTAGDNGSEVVGTVPYLLIASGENDSRSAECTLGNAVADALRIYLNSDIAIVSGGDLVANLPSGEITWDTLRSVFAEDRPLATVTVTIRQLREILEAGLFHIVLDESERIDVFASAYNGFPQISGFTIRYDASSAPGDRVRDVVINNESVKLDDNETTVTLAATSFILEGGYGLPKVAGTIVPSGMTLVDVMARYVNDGMADYRKMGDRIRPMGVGNITVSGFLIAGVIVVVSLLSWSRKKRMMKRFSNFTL